MGQAPPPGDALSSVGLTALWALHHRSLHLQDPVAERVLLEIRRRQGPVGPSMGRRTPTMAHYFTQRARLFDAEIRLFLSRHPDAVIVTLGEGLDTQFWRVDDGRLRWIGVDMPEVIRLRRDLMPPSDRITHVACSVLDSDWIREVPDDRPLLITAQGLFMYLRPRQIMDLLHACARRYPGHTVLFDTAPWWFVGLSRLGGLRCGGFRIPSMSSSLSPRGLARLRSRLPAGTTVAHVPARHSSGPFRLFHRHGHRVPLVGTCVPATVRVTFPRQPAAASVDGH
ncbi:class I SAM-dependent methyltransferase [Streptomyces sp. DH12]|uniref:class I SAM-dependent methyltransferase n=1 Tax=Streptomyces sp. DH12 TaxID=2857010 RepID=UPI001E469436|nr:class I SAM-dependent methyltransferase [Streptomyces sp. DH12]